MARTRRGGLATRPWVGSCASPLVCKHRLLKTRCYLLLDTLFRIAVSVFAEREINREISSFGLEFSRHGRAQHIATPTRRPRRDGQIESWRAAHAARGCSKLSSSAVLHSWQLLLDTQRTAAAVLRARRNHHSSHMEVGNAGRGVTREATFLKLCSDRGGKPWSATFLGRFLANAGGCPKHASAALPRSSTIEFTWRPSKTCAAHCKQSPWLGRTRGPCRADALDVQPHLGAC